MAPSKGGQSIEGQFNIAPGVHEGQHYHLRSRGKDVRENPSNVTIPLPAARSTEEKATSTLPSRGRKSLKMANDDSESEYGFSADSESNSESETEDKWDESLHQHVQNFLHAIETDEKRRLVEQKENHASRKHLKESRKQAYSKIKSLQRKRHNLQGKVKNCNDAFEKLTRELEEKDETLEAIKSERHRFIMYEDQILYPDDVVRDKLANVIKPWKKFARNYAHDTFEGVNQTTWNALRCELQKSLNEIGSARTVEAIEKRTIRPSIILHALLSHFVCQQFFARPFGFLNQVNSTEADDGLEAQLLAIAELGSCCSPMKAEKWRALTISMLSPPEHVAHTEGDKKREKRIASYKREHCEGCVAYFGSQPAVALLLKESKVQQLQKELLNIFEKALDLSMKIFGQNQVVKVLSFKNLQDERFSATSSVLRPHNEMHLDEEDEEKLKGLRLDVVVEPGIMARTIGHGEEQGPEKKWWTPLGLSIDGINVEPTKGSSNNEARGTGDENFTAANVSQLVPGQPEDSKSGILNVPQQTSVHQSSRSIAEPLNCVGRMDQSETSSQTLKGESSASSTNQRQPLVIVSTVSNAKHQEVPSVPTSKTRKEARRPAAPAPSEPSLFCSIMNSIPKPDRSSLTNDGRRGKGENSEPPTKKAKVSESNASHQRAIVDLTHENESHEIAATRNSAKRRSADISATTSCGGDKKETVRTYRG